MTIKSINPSTYRVLGEVEISTPKEIKAKVETARKSQPEWAKIGIAKRVELLKKTFVEFAKRKEEFALLQASEMGMPLSEALTDVDGTMDYANWYFDNAEKYLSPETTFENESEIHQVFYEPIGVVASIVPWNFPFANFVWGVLQGLIAGNTVVFKHSEECPLCGKFLEEVLTKHLPNGVFSEVYGAGDVGTQLVCEPVDLITFTGSTKVGKFLYELASKKFIKTIMELGGSAPGIIFKDADLDVAVDAVCLNRLINQGQACDGLKRLIVEESVLKPVLEKTKKIFAGKKIGPAENKDTQIGPLVAKRQLDLLVAQVEDAKKKGAKVIAGGNSLEKKLGGAFFEPTILTNITPTMRVWSEEVFGPVLPIVTFKTEEKALKLANETSYGLGSYLFTADKKRAERLARQIQAGMVSINGVSYIMPFNPFGGYKNSGFGREHGEYGFHEVTQIKVVSRPK